ncbi:hypothetical protein [Clostridium sp.]|nr:hypothetical protein [Clostridium sp.]
MNIRFIDTSVLLNITDNLGYSEEEFLKVRYNKHTACNNCKQCAYLR